MSSHPSSRAATPRQSVLFGDGSPASGLRKASSPDTENISTTITNAPSPRRWSSSSGSQMSLRNPQDSPLTAGDTPIPIGGSGKLSMVFSSLFKSRHTSTSVTTETRINEALSLARQQVESLSQEVAMLRAQLSTADRELSSQQSRLDALDGTNAHCQKLLKRNADLELLVADIQDDSEARMRELRHELERLRREINEKSSSMSVLQDELQEKNRTCCMKAVSNEVKKVQEMAAELARNEDELASAKRDLEMARIDLRSAMNEMATLRSENADLRSERLASQSTLSGVSDEVQRSVALVNDLEKQLNEMRHAKKATEDQLNASLAATELEGAKKDSEIAGLKRELGRLRAQLGDIQRDMESLTRDKQRLQQELNEAENRRDSYQNLMLQLRESEEKRRLEQTHHEETLNRLKSQLASYKDVHAQAAELLRRNGELEQALAQHLKTLSSHESTEVQRLRQLLKEKEGLLMKQEARLVHAAQNESAHEHAIQELNRRIQAAEIAAQRLAQQPHDSAAVAKSIQEAIQQTRQQELQDAESRLKSMKNQYEVLLASIRKAHDTELLQKEDELNDKINRAVAAKAAALQKDQDEAIARVHEQRDAEISRLKKEKEEEMKKIRMNYDQAIAEGARKMDDRIREMQKSIDRAVASATADLHGENDSLKKQIQDMAADRDELRTRELQLRKDLQKLNGIIVERDMALKAMTKEMNTQESNHKKAMNELNSALGLKAAKDASANAEWARLVERNAELEQMVAALSEKHHDEMKNQQGKLLQLENELRKAERRASRLSMETEDLKRDLAGQKSPRTVIDKNEFRKKEVALEEAHSELAAKESLINHLRRELERTKVRMADVQQDYQKALSGNPDRYKYQRDLIDKLTALQKMISADNQNAKASVVANAQHEAAQKRLAAEINHMKTQLTVRQQRIEALQNSLKDLQNELTAHPEQQHTVDEMRNKLKEVQQERNKFSHECKLLQEQLSHQAGSLSTEIERRKAQLSELQTTNDRLSSLLTTNSHLESQVKSLFDEMKRDLRRLMPDDTGSKVSVSTVASITETLTVFEEEFHKRSEQHESDMRNLTKALEDREMDIERLQNELRILRNNLERVHREEMESLRMGFDTDKARLEGEIRTLTQSKQMVESELSKVRDELSEAKAFDATRIDSMIHELTRKMQDQQLMIAEMQDEKDAEIRRIEAKLESARAAQSHLEEEIARVSKKLHQKEREIIDLSSELQWVIRENDNLSGQAMMTAADEEKLMNTVSSLFEKLVESQGHANSLIVTLQALLREQEQGLEEMARSQVAVSQARSNMLNLVNTFEVPSELNRLVGMRSEVETASQSLSQSSRQDRDLISQLRASVVAKQDALEKFKQNARQRDDELSDMRARLTNLQMQDALHQDLSRDDSSMTQKVLSEALSSVGAIGSLNNGLENLQKELEEIKSLRQSIQNRRGNLVNRRTVPAIGSLSTASTHETVTIVRRSELTSSETMNDSTNKRRLTPSLSGEQHVKLSRH
eukprot:Blabericola_migrator_1__10284@NODE_576_length_7504_cov_229_698131_g428_i0_p1_GENE_NODE_576_length_7504_cov_229_698131_g428_i0NODE_576_length_7504_cov_229_698131_g428_i0_p1_ORF_typecomplete_len1507_score395_37Filament/PF00038_21/0_007Filament/PF00038_21/0_13Filament/PF00038_21/0_76Filament/PF00038_21/0_16Filament/PF00038_21/0_33Filament/PF00038_21/12Filament/PF00038_21/3_6e02Filament/PF00038_21/5_1e03HOOK/PF05622_12/2_1e05HOOK/PF05622_12/12Myosin_tail_1/PF01576_19/0_21Myosin_tail_1/PF01576_19/4_4